MALLCAFGAANAHAQQLDQTLTATDDAGQMLLEADTLIYDNDRQTVTAEGDVRIEYDGNRLVARRIVYNQQTGRIVAIGDVEVVQPDGTRIFSDELDITEDFRDGFINALRVETAEKTYLAAESAERRAGLLTVFRNGVYTACEPCEDKPGRPPIWRVKSRKIIWNGEAKTVRFENPRFELFGLPIAYLPFFEMADPSVKRKSGLLMPTIGYSNELGFRYSQPYFLALSPTYDVTLVGHYHAQQGFLAEAEWRQRFNNGIYTLKAAGISQRDQEAFDLGTVDRAHRSRWMLGTKGVFQINPRWTFGWDVLVQSDSNFANTYSIRGFSAASRTEQIYLTGLNDRNYFDLRFMKFRYQDVEPSTSTNTRDPKQPWVLPSLDYSYTLDDPVAGGELGFDVNLAVVNRSRLDFVTTAPAIYGVEETSGRLSAEAEWKRSVITSGGVVLTPVLGARGDAIGTDLSADTVSAYSTMAAGISGARYSQDGSTYGSVATDVRSSYFRAMATAGLEARWPVLFSTTSATHVLEPVGQIFVRPDAPYGDTLAIPNEDAQSLVFDAANLFERDKFSGYDLIEGGTRANVGFRYSGDFGGGWTTNAIFGQSYHLAGENPYAQPNLVNAGAFSGLETRVSDFVGGVSLQTPIGLELSAGGRFDESTFEVRRANVGAGAKVGMFSVGANYAFIEAQPLYGFAKDRREVSLSGGVRLAENWSVFGSGTYDLTSATLATSSIGFGYGDECFVYSMNFERTETTTSRKVDYNIGFRISFRTIGEFGATSGEVRKLAPEE